MKKIKVPKADSMVSGATDAKGYHLMPVGSMKAQTGKSITLKHGKAMSPHMMRRMMKAKKVSDLSY